MPAGGPGVPGSVVFDVGGVLYDWHPRHLYRKLIVDPGRLDWFLDNVVTLEWHFQHDAGRPFAETSAELIERFPDYRDLITLYDARWLETIPGPIPGMIGLVDELAAAGVPLYAITNFSHEFWPRFMATAPVFRHFRNIVVSGDERLVKPDPAIFALAAARFGIGPGDALFIDDRADNVAASEAAGFVGHVFDGVAPLRARLRDLRLLG